MRARILTLSNGYCHVALVTNEPDDQRIFVHAESCDFLLADCQPGDVLELQSVVETRRGPRGEGATSIERPMSGALVTGRVSHVIPSKGIAFLKPDDGTGDVLFLHTRAFRDYRNGESQLFMKLAPGDRLQCRRVACHPRDRGEHIEAAA